MKPSHARPATKSDETPAFKELWETIWPSVKSHYDARALARDAYFRHVWWKDAEEQDIIDAARFYVRSGHNSGDGPRMLLSNWLDRGFYEDLAEQERAYQARLLERERRREVDRTNVVTMQPPASESISPERRAELVAKIRLQRA